MYEVSKGSRDFSGRFDICMKLLDEMAKADVLGLLALSPFLSSRSLKTYGQWESGATLLQC